MEFYRFSTSTSLKKCWCEYQLFTWEWFLSAVPLWEISLQVFNTPTYSKNGKIVVFLLNLSLQLTHNLNAEATLSWCHLDRLASPRATRLRKLLRSPEAENCALTLPPAQRGWQSRALRFQLCLPHPEQPSPFHSWMGASLAHKALSTDMRFSDNMKLGFVFWSTLMFFNWCI